MRFSASPAPADSDSVTGSLDAVKLARQVRERAFRARKQDQTVAMLTEKQQSQLPTNQKMVSDLRQRRERFAQAAERADPLAFQEPGSFRRQPMTRPLLPKYIYTQKGKSMAFKMECELESGPLKFTVPDAPKKEHMRKDIDGHLSVEEQGSFEDIGRSRRKSLLYGRRRPVRRLRNETMMKDRQLAEPMRPSTNEAGPSRSSTDEVAKEDVAQRVQRRPYNGTSFDSFDERLPLGETPHPFVVARLTSYDRVFDRFPSSLSIIPLDKKFTFETIPWPTISPPRAPRNITPEAVKDFWVRRIRSYKIPSKMATFLRHSNSNCVSLASRIINCTMRLTKRESEEGFVDAHLFDIGSTELETWSSEMIMMWLMPRVEERERDLVWEAAQNTRKALYTLTERIENAYKDKVVHIDALIIVEGQENI